MPKIELEILIKADIEVCFDLSRSIDLHQLSTTQTDEKAIAGRTSGLINLNEFVTWKARHFGITQQLTSRITQYSRPFHFRDEQEKGIFNFICHDHFFEATASGVIMRDVFEFKSPLGLLGSLADSLVLKRYLTGFLIDRNRIIKEYAESDKWKSVLNIQPSISR